jgi:hypothetical protein
MTTLAPEMLKELGGFKPLVAVNPTDGLGAVKNYIAVSSEVKICGEVRINHTDIASYLVNFHDIVCFVSHFQAKFKCEVRVLNKYNHRILIAEDNKIYLNRLVANKIFITEIGLRIASYQNVELVPMHEED